MSAGPICSGWIGGCGEDGAAAGHGGAGWPRPFVGPDAFGHWFRGGAGWPRRGLGLVFGQLENLGGNGWPSFLDHPCPDPEGHGAIGWPRPFVGFGPDEGHGGAGCPRPFVGPDAFGHWFRGGAGWPRPGCGPAAGQFGLCAGGLAKPAP